MTVKAHVSRTHVSKSVKGVKFTSSTPVPAVLHTCRESRVEALKTYTMGLITYCCSGRFYVDYTRDTIYINSVTGSCHWDLGSFARDMPAKERRKIQYLAVEQALFDLERFENTEMLFDLRGLKTMTLVMEKPQRAKSKLTLFRGLEHSDSTIIQWGFDNYEEENSGHMRQNNGWRIVWKSWRKSHVCRVRPPRLELRCFPQQDRGG